MLAFPNAKINIGLYITGKRSDGFHNLESCFYPIPWTDGLEIVPASETRFSSSGLSIPGNQEDNLCLKAHRLLQQEFELPTVHIHLHKVLPTGAGLGGGSADAAFTLKLLNDIAGLKLTTDQVEAYARKLGSDCAFFVRNQPVFAHERGDVFEELDVRLKGLFLVVAHPGIHISTAEAYSRIQPKPAPNNLRQVLQKPVSEWKDLVKNDFEEALFPHYPELSSLKNSLYAQGAVYAAMSGSGSAVFGLFTEEASLHLPEKYLVWKGFL